MIDVMTTIGIDCRFAATPTGLGRYTREVTSALLRRRDPWRYALFMRSDDDARWIPHEAVASYDMRPAPFPHYSWKEQIVFPRLLKQSKIHLLFSPHFNVPFFCPVPFVSTIHDLILHHFPNQASFPRRAAYKILMGRTVRRAKHLIAVSDFTRGELLSAYGKRAVKRTSVIQEAVNPLFRPMTEADCAMVREKYGLTKPFFLYVGNAKEHKNVQTLIDAFDRSGLLDHELVLVTGGKEAASLRAGTLVRVIDRVEEHELPALYSLTRCFVSASLYEGFGLPVLEAAACRASVAVSDRSSFPEIAPQGTVLIKPTVAAFTELFRSPPTIIPEKPGRTWDQVAADTASILFSALD
jgi:glycosyltransferase involved in cell wall biosynthesis